MITKHPWFGPKRVLGWGLVPVSWEGWAATVTFVAAALGVRWYYGPGFLGLAPKVACVVVFIAVIVLTGTKPGGPGFGTKD